MDTQPDETEAACDDQRASQTAPSSSTDADMEAPPGPNANDVRKGLAKYLQDLKGRLFRDGTPLIVFPQSFSAQVHALMDRWKQRRQGRLSSAELVVHDSKSLKSGTNDDMEICHGLNKIAKLDEALREKQLEQLMVSRETYPEKWLKHDSDRIRKHGATVEATIRKQRKDHARQRALRLKLFELGHDIGDDQLATHKLLDRGFHLRHEDELLLATILNRNQEVERMNPYDLHMPPVAFGIEDSAAGAGSASTLEELDSKIMDLALDHDWNDCNSMMDMSTLGSHNARKCIPEVALSVRRLGTSRSGSVATVGAQKGVGGCLSVISEDSQCHDSSTGQPSSRAANCYEGMASEPLPLRRKQIGRDYLTEMREERHLGRLSDKIDKEIRTLREAEMPKASASAIKAAVEQCLHQVQVHDERIQSGASVCEWLRTPGLDKRATTSTFDGAVSMAGPALEHGMGTELDRELPAAPV